MESKEYPLIPVVQKEIHAISEAVNTFIKDRFHGKMGFVILLFDLDAHGTISYSSNAQRSDMIQALEELTSNLKKTLTDEQVVKNDKKENER